MARWTGHHLVPAADVVDVPKDNLGQKHGTTPASSVAVGPRNSDNVRSVRRSEYASTTYLFDADEEYTPAPNLTEAPLSGPIQT